MDFAGFKITEGEEGAPLYVISLVNTNPTEKKVEKEKESLQPPFPKSLHALLHTVKHLTHSFFPSALELGQFPE